MVTTRRPGTGLAPHLIDRLIGKTAIVAVAEGALLEPGMFV